MTYLQSQSTASLATDGNSGKIQRIMGLGRISRSWGFAFKWVAISAETPRSFIMSLQPAACLWIKNVAWNQRSELSLFCQVCWDKMRPSLLGLSLSLPPSQETFRGSWTPSPLPDELLPWELLSLSDLLMLPTQPQSCKHPSARGCAERILTRKCTCTQKQTLYSRSLQHFLITSTNSDKYSWYVTTGGFWPPS